MSDSLRIADHLWNDAEELVDRMEHSSRVESAEQVVYDQLTSELLPISGASSVTFWVTDHGQTRTISLNGTATASPSSVGSDSSNRDPCLRAVADHCAPLAKWSDPLCLEATATVTSQTTLGLTLRFDKPVDGTLSRPLCELSETLLGLIVTVYLRHRYATLSNQLDQQSNRDRVLDELNRGNDLYESFAAISRVVANETLADRVSALRVRGNRFQLIASSTQPHVDRRARQVRLLERLVSTCCDCVDQFHFVVGRATTDDTVGFEQILHDYIGAAGCREIRIETIRRQETDSSSNSLVAALVVERFHVDTPADHAQDLQQARLQAPVQAAIRRAVQRSEVSWSTVARRLVAARPSRRITLIASIAMLMAIALAILPVELKIPVEGRLLATKQRRVFAPTDAVVSQLHVQHGQQVTEGQLLVSLRSARLDQQQRQLEGALATAQSRLLIAAASKSRGGGSRSSEQDGFANSTASSDEQVLKTEISGLQQQLELILRQQDELSLKSPIAGTVDRWDLNQSLSSRPVVHGQFLIDVVSTADGWTVELDIPDAESQYVVDAQASQPCDVSFRMRSNPDQSYRGKLAELSQATQMDAAGNQVVRGTLNFNDNQDGSVRTGATVIAHIHCGSRPLGFVWFRSLIQWSRRSDWL